MKKVNWFSEIVSVLPHTPDFEPETFMWTDGEEILCISEKVANALIETISNLYSLQGERYIFTTGYYDPEEDKNLILQISILDGGMSVVINFA